MSRDIFISHAVKDKDLVENFVDNILQLGMGISTEDIFCSSLSGMGIPSGKNFIDYIKEEIQQPKVVIVFFSKSYISSQFCMCELGATWAMTHKILPILVPPLTYSDVKGVLTGIQVDKLNDADDLNRFQQTFSEILEKDILFPQWEKKRNKFLKESESILNKMIEEMKREKNLDHLSIETMYKDLQKKNELNRTNSSYSKVDMQGIIGFDYSNNDGLYTIGSGELEFTTMWSKSSDTNIHAYKDPENIKKISRVKGKDIENLKQNLNDICNLDFSSRTRTPDIGDIIVWINIYDNVAFTKILDINDDTRGHDNDYLKFEYQICPK